MADDLSVVNAARVSFARRRTEMSDADAGLIRFLMRDRHGTPFEHNSFRFHIRCPMFVAREWFRHRVGCLTGDTTVTFVNTYGHAVDGLAKTMDDLWRMWTEGERDGHALDADTAEMVTVMARFGLSQRTIARDLAIGRRAVRTHLEGKGGMRDARWRVRGMDLRVLDESTNEFTVGHIEDIVDKGIQPVYRVTLDRWPGGHHDREPSRLDRRRLADDAGGSRPGRRRLDGAHDAPRKLHHEWRPCVPGSRLARRSSR